MEQRIYTLLVQLGILALSIAIPFMWSTTPFQHLMSITIIYFVLNVIRWAMDADLLAYFVAACGATGTIITHVLLEANITTAVLLAFVVGLLFYRVMIAHKRAKNLIEFFRNFVGGILFELVALIVKRFCRKNAFEG